MKLQIIFSAAVVPLIVLTLLSPFITSCGRKDTPKKEESKSEAPAKAQNTDQKHEGANTVVLSPEQVKAAGIEVQKVVPNAFGAALSATASIEPNNDRVSRVGARVTGRIAKVTATQGDRVKAGQALAYLESVELDQAWSDYAKVKGKQTLTAANLKREETLFEKKVSPEKDVLKARQEFSEVEADVVLAAKRLRILGVEESKLGSASDAIKNNHLLLAIPSPLSGVVVEKAVSQGEMVSPEKVLFTVSDLSSLWVVIDVYERDLSRFRTGMAANVQVAAYPERTFKGRISYVGDVMDEKTRTIKARVTIDNRNGLLKPGMFATVSMESAKDPRAEKVIAIPEEALFRDGSENYVFLSNGEGRFVTRQVSIGTVSGQRVAIKEGLKAGDAVVIKGVFALKSELKKETLEAE